MRPHTAVRLTSAAVLAQASALALPAAGASTTAPLAGRPHDLTAVSSGEQSDRPSPNVVFILADDLGWADLHTGLVSDGHGSDFNDTPTLDRLAAEGMTFDNAYASINCSPTRMALLSGLYATRPENNVYAQDGLTRGKRQPLLVGPHEGREDQQNVLADDTQTVAETLQGAGYRTGYIGKFQVTRSAADIVAQHGFDESFGGINGGSVTNYFASGGHFDDAIGPELDRFAGDYTRAYVDDDIAPYSTGVSSAQLQALVGTHKHLTDAVADATLDFIDRNDDQPFFAWMSTYAVHAPTGNGQARPDLLAKYRARTPGQSPASPSYASLVEGVDQSVARVVHELETVPDPRNPGHVLADNTLVVFASDNGGRTDYGADNGPLAGEKGQVLEGGVRVPWLVWSDNPDLVDGGTVNHSVINSTDLYPTLAAYAGAQLPGGVPFDGTNLLPAFENDEQVDRPRFTHFPGYLLQAKREQRPQSWVRDGPWKLTYSYEDQSISLVDLGTDIGETTNVAADHPALVEQLGKELVGWLDDTDAPLATLRKTRRPLTIQVPPGLTYADGQVHSYDRATTLTIQPDQQVPLVLPIQQSAAASSGNRATPVA